MSKELSEKIKQALDVAAAFDNCFFHSYAMYLIANKLPLPKELFTFVSILGDESPASQLQKRFPHQDSLSLFAEYSQRHHPHDKSCAASFIFEKTLVLGFFFREWFATQMAGNLKIRDAMHAEVLHKFIIYTEFRAVMSKDELLMGEEGVLYAANEEFLEYFHRRSQCDIQDTLSQQEQQFEHYFTTNGEDKNKALIAYWNEQGYPKYCQLLATPGVKLAQNDVAPVIKLLGQRLTIYNPNAMVLREIDGNVVTPKMEIVLYAADGHYCLLNTNATTTVFAEYAQSYAQYKKDRTETLASIGNKLTVANAKPSLLVGAICPPGLLEKAPFALLLDKVDVMSNFVTEFDKTKEQEDAQRRKEQEDAQRRKEQEDAQRRKEQEDAQRRKEQEDAQRRKKQEDAQRRKEQEDAQRRKEQEDAQRRKEQEDAQRRKEQEDAQRRKEQEDAQRRKEQEDAQRRKEQEDAQRRKEPEDAQRRKEQEDAQRRKEPEDAQRRKEQEDAQRRKEPEDAQRRKVQEDAQRRKEQEDAQRRKEQEDAQRRKVQEDAQRRKVQEDAQRRKVQEDEARRAQIGVIFAKIDVALRGLNNKIGLVEQHHFQAATIKAQESLAQLKKARDEYYTALERPDADRLVANKNFKKECAAIINNAKPILVRDLGWGDYLGNLLKSLINIVIYGITLGTVHSFFTPVKSVSLNAVEQAESVLVC